MAWRFSENVLRGELDNTRRGRVKGTIWLAGIELPFHLVLRGDCAPDLAGCTIAFENPKPVPMDATSLPQFVQTGWVGEITSARRFKVPDVPIEEFVRMKNGPFHWANTLSLEWHSKTDGEISLHMHDFKLTVSTHEWTLSPEEYEASREVSSAEFIAWSKEVFEWSDEDMGMVEKVDIADLVHDADDEGEEWKRPDTEDDEQPPKR